MKLEQIREIIKLMQENDLAEIDLESEGEKVRIVSARGRIEVAPVQMTAPSVLPSAPLAVAKPTAAPEEPEEIPDSELIKSPIVGTFYRAPSPESPNYIEAGDAFEDDTVVCIVEAMKVMNEIAAEKKGRIVEVLVNNAHPVEFGQPLFRIAAE